MKKHIIKSHKFIKDEEYSKIENDCSIVAWVPHGIMPCSVYLIENDNSVIFCATIVYYIITYFYLVIFSRGGIVTVTKENIIKAIYLKKQINLYPGGISESLITDPNKELKNNIYDKHMGFVKIAYEHNLPLVPVVAYNEDKLLYNVNSKLANFTYKLCKIPIIIPYYNNNYPCEIIIHYKKPLYPKDFKSYEEMHKKFYEIVFDTVK